MSIRAIAWAWEQELPATTKLVLLALADCSHPETGATFPSQGFLAQKTGVSRQSVNLHLSKLEQLGLISSERTFDESGRELNKRYTLNFIARCLADRHTGVKEPDTGGVKQLDTEPRVEEPEVESLKISMPREFVRTPFELFWEAYPRHVGRAAAEVCFIKALKRGHDPSEIVRKAAEFKAHCERNAKPIQFIPHPSTWLNQCRWNDELVDDQPEVNNGRQNAKEELLKWAFSEDEPVVEHAPGDLTILPGGDSWDSESQGGSIFDVPKRIRGPCG